MNYLELLISLLVFLVLLSAFFSASETAVTSLNRYRLRHLVRRDYKPAKRINKLLERPDRLLGIILIGNTFANIFASAIATVIAVKLFGNTGVVVATIALTIVVLIFAEVTPKTLAVLYPERLSFLVSLPLTILLTLLYPLVWVANGIANGVLRLFKIKVKHRTIDPLSHEELSTVVHEATNNVTTGYQNMVLGVLNLGGITVDDIKVPRSEIVGIDVNEDWQMILMQLKAAQHTRIPIYRDSIDDVLGILHLRKALNLLAQMKLTKETLITAAEEVYYIPENTPLNVQLLNFRENKFRIGLIVDEYGDIQGLVTLEDILEEIVGEFTTNLATSHKDIKRQKDGGYLVDGAISIRELNRVLSLKLPMDGPKTLSGLIVENLEMIPQVGISLRIADYYLEIMEVEDNMVKQARITHIKI